MNLSNENLIRIEPSIKDAKIKIERASRFLNSSKKILQILGQDKDIDKNLIYSNIYDAIRIACEALLLFKGYKVKRGENHHFNVFTAAKELLTGELINEFQRIQKMRKNRNRIDYGVFIISEDSLDQSLKDAMILLHKINEIIQKGDLQNILI